MLVCVAASGEQCCGADLLIVGFETCFESAPWQRDTTTRACMCLRARLRVSTVSERAPRGLSSRLVSYLSSD